MPPRTQLCTLGLFYAPWGSSTHPPASLRAPSYAYAPPLYVRAPSLCVRTLGSFKPLVEARILIFFALDFKLVPKPEV
jgi:hypothetical protein